MCGHLAHFDRPCRLPARSCRAIPNSSAQAKYGDEAAKQIAARRQREAELAAGGEDANLIPLGVRVGETGIARSVVLMRLAQGWEGEDANLIPLGVRVRRRAACFGCLRWVHRM